VPVLANAGILLAGRFRPVLNNIIGAVLSNITGTVPSNIAGAIIFCTGD